MSCNSEALYFFTAIIFTFIVLLIIHHITKYLKSKRLLLSEKNLAIESLHREILTLKEELDRVSKSLDNSLHQTRELKSQLAYSRKMTELGKLVAGVAHELNNPISAIKASSETVIEITHKEIGEMQKAKEIFQSLNDSELQMLVDIVSKNKDTASVMSYRERKEKRNHLKIIFEKNNFEYQEDEIEKFLDVGLESPSESDLKILSHKNSTIRPYILSMRNLGQHLVIIKIAVERAASLLLALKKFSRFSDSHESKQFHLIENIETVLSIYRYQMRGNLSLNKTFLTDAILSGFPEEIFQVWTNIFLNAMQAMNHNGNLSIHIQKVEPDQVEIKIKDNGPGIPIEIQNRIFDSDFTTKEMGEGSGMGLGLTKSIIENHKGTISVISEFGNTEFRITLPVTAYVSCPN